MKKDYFKPTYDCILIGSALSGMAAALSLYNQGMRNILILERQATPGGVATSFMRSNFELEASLHEMCSIGSEEYPLGVRKFLEDNNIFVNWLRIDQAFRYTEPGLDVIVHAGENGHFERPAKDIADALGDKTGELYDKILLFFNDCHRVYNSIRGLSDGKLLSIELIQSHIDMLRSLGYSLEEVIKPYNLPDKAVRILSAYWCYLGNTPDDLPYALYSYIIADYIGYGPYICKDTSHELSIKMAEECQRRNIQIEYEQEVQKILVEDDHVIGVKLDDGTCLYSNYVISGAYPNAVYSKMIEPKSAVDEKAYQMINSRKLSMTVFSLIMVLDAPKEELGLDTYMTFSAPKGMDFDKIKKACHSHDDYLYLTSVCLNVGNEKCSKEGTTIYSITALFYPDGWNDVNVDNYDSWKEKIARKLILADSKRLGVNLLDHILEIEYITPVSIAHHSRSFQGCVYGFLSSQNDAIGARILTHASEQIIPGLAFAGAHQYAGDGMGPAIINGIQAANDIIVQYNADMPKQFQKIINAKKK